MDTKQRQELLNNYKEQINKVSEFLTEVKKDTIFEKGSDRVLDLFHKVVEMKYNLINILKLGNTLTKDELLKCRKYRHILWLLLGEFKRKLSWEQVRELVSKKATAEVRSEFVLTPSVWRELDSKYGRTDAPENLIDNLFEFPDRYCGERRKVYFVGSETGSNKSLLMSQMALSIITETPLFFTDRFKINNRDERGDLRPIIWISCRDKVDNIAGIFFNQFQKFVELGYIKKEIASVETVLRHLEILSPDVLTEFYKDSREFENFVISLNPSAIFIDDFFALNRDKYKFMQVDFKNMKEMYGLFKPFRELSNMGYLSIFSHPFKDYSDEEDCLEQLSTCILSIDDKPNDKATHQMNFIKCNYLAPEKKEKVSLVMDYPIFKCVKSKKEEDK
jgi:hypothetical protein